MTFSTPYEYHELAAKLKKQGFSALDKGKARTVRVDANELIDLCLGFEEAAKGDFSNIEYVSQMYREDNRKLYMALRKIEKMASDACYESSGYFLLDEEDEPCILTMKM